MLSGRIGVWGGKNNTGEKTYLAQSDAGKGER